jgi:hypothetical protein
VELFTTHRLGTPTASPWKAHTIEEEVKEMRSIVEMFKFNSLQLQITDEQGKHSHSSVKLQNVHFDSASIAEHNI